MTSRQLAILGALTALAIIAATFLSQHRTGDDVIAGTPLYTDLGKQLDTVQSLQIFKAGDQRAVELVRKDDVWTLTERDGYRADTTKLRTLLRALSDAKIVEEKTSRPESYATLGVDDQSTRLELNGTSPPVRLIVGKDVADGHGQYVRRAGEAKSWLVNQSLDVPATADAWLDKEFVNIRADRIQSVTIDMGSGRTYSAAKKDRAASGFTVTTLPRSKPPADESSAVGFATALAGLSLTDVSRADAAAKPVTTAIYKTFDGLVLKFAGYEQGEKAFVTVQSSYDAAQAEHFKLTSTPAADGKADAKEASVADEAAALAKHTAGWHFEIARARYDSLFKPRD